MGEVREPKAAAVLASAELAGSRSRALRGLLTWAALPWLLVAVGAGIRVERFFDNRSLWLDEAFLALNLIDRPLRELVEGNLGYDQSAPVGFLALEKGAIALLGDNELALRLLSLLAGLAALVLFQRIAVRLLPRPAVALVVGLFAISEPLVYYSAEVKPYSSDVALAAALTLLYLRFEDGDTRDPRRLLTLGVAGALAVWVSYPVVFVLAGIGVAIVVSSARHARGLANAGLVGGVWLASFAVAYHVSSTSITSVSHAYYGASGAKDGLLGRFAGSLHDSWSAVVDPGGFPHATNWLAGPVIAVGIAWIMVRVRLSRRALLLVPGLAAFGAAVLDRYPAAGRFWLFLVPFGLVALGYGVTALVRAARRPLLVAMPLALVLSVAIAERAAENTLHPPRSEDIKPLLHTLAVSWRAGDALYVYPKSQYALRYYAECKSCDVRGPFPWPVIPADGAGDGNRALLSSPGTVVIGADGRVVPDVRSLDGKPRVWLLFSSVIEHDGRSDEDVALGTLYRVGRRLTAVRRKNASLYLFDLGGAR